MWVLIVCHVLVSGYVQFWFVMLVIYKSFHFFFPYLGKIMCGRVMFLFALCVNVDGCFCFCFFGFVLLDGFCVVQTHLLNCHVLLNLLFLAQACFTCSKLALSFFFWFILLGRKRVRVLLKESFFFLGYMVDSDSIVIVGLLDFFRPLFKIV